GEEHVLGADQDDPRGTGETRQVADVHQLRHQHRVGADLRQPRANAVPPCLGHRCSFTRIEKCPAYTPSRGTPTIPAIASSASAYPFTPSPTIVPFATPDTSDSRRK